MCKLQKRQCQKINDGHVTPWMNEMIRNKSVMALLCLLTLVYNSWLTCSELEWQSGVKKRSRRRKTVTSTKSKMLLCWHYCKYNNVSMRLGMQFIFFFFFLCRLFFFLYISNRLSSQLRGVERSQGLPCELIGPTSSALIGAAGVTASHFWTHTWLVLFD